MGRILFLVGRLRERLWVKPLAFCLLAVLGVLPDVNIVARTDHQDAIGLGQGVTEFNPKGQAAGEIRRLWTWIEKRTQVARHVKAA